MITPYRRKAIATNLIGELTGVAVCDGTVTGLFTGLLCTELVTVLLSTVLKEDGIVRSKKGCRLKGINNEMIKERSKYHLRLFSVVLLAMNNL